jgi:L-ascorbate metabolism protein UlaG (beta-lactamase superfamily)
MTMSVLGMAMTGPFSLVRCSSMKSRSHSDHFNGRTFYNPTLSEQFSLGLTDVIRMLFEKRAKWPRSVENQGTPHLHQLLKDDQVALTFINHATFLIQFPHLNILTDPIWSDRASPFSFAGPKRVRKPGVPIEELPKIDVIVISHNHYDHLDIETIKTLNKLFAPKVLVPIGDKALIKSIGIKDVQELDWWQAVQVGQHTTITFTPVQHSSRRGLFDRDRSLWGSYFIQNEQRSVYFGGDAGYSTHYTDIRTRLGAADIGLLGIGSYSPRWFMKPIHMNPEEAVRAHQDLQVNLSIAMHFGTFQLSNEAINQPNDELKAALAKEGLSGSRFITLQEGETRVYGAEIKRKGLPGTRFKLNLE